MGPGGAGRRRAGIRSFQPQADGHLPRGHVGDEHGDHERAELLRPFGLQDRVLVLDELHAAHAAADDRPAPEGILLLEREAGIDDRLFRRRDGELDEALGTLRLLWRQVRGRIEPLHLGRDLRIEGARVKVGDAAQPAAAG